MGCLWYFLLSQSALEIHVESGAERYPLDELVTADWGTKWLYCFYWATGMITGFCPFDITPTQPDEIIFDTLCMMIGSVFNAFVISSTTSAIANMDSMATHHKTKLDRIDHYLRFHNVAPELRLRIVQFYKYLFVASQSSDDLSLFRDLPTQMSLHLSVAINRALITKCPLFAALENRTILLVIQRMNPFTFPPEHTVVRRGKPCATLFFVSRGILWEVDENEECVKELGDHDFFGEQGMVGAADGAGLGPVSASTSVVTKTFSCLLALTHGAAARVRRRPRARRPRRPRRRGATLTPRAVSRQPPSSRCSPPPRATTRRAKASESGSSDPSRGGSRAARRCAAARAPALAHPPAFRPRASPPARPLP